MVTSNELHRNRKSPVAHLQLYMQVTRTPLKSGLSSPIVTTNGRGNMGRVRQEMKKACRQLLQVVASY